MGKLLCTYTVSQWYYLIPWSVIIWLTRCNNSILCHLCIWENILKIWIYLYSAVYGPSRLACVLLETVSWAENTWWCHQMETFSALLALCAGNSPVPVNSPHNGQWRGALLFTLICVWINDWVNNREAGDLRRHRGHYDVNVMNATCSTFVRHEWVIRSHVNLWDIMT